MWWRWPYSLQTLNCRLAAVRRSTNVYRSLQYVSLALYRPVLTYPLDLLHARSAAHVTAGLAAATPGPPGATGAAAAAAAPTLTTYGASSSGAPSAPSKAFTGLIRPAPTPAPIGVVGSARHLTAVVRVGGVRALYAGLGPTLMGIVPYGGASAFMTHHDSPRELDQRDTHTLASFRVEGTTFGVYV